MNINYLFNVDKDGFATPLTKEQFMHPLVKAVYQQGKTGNVFTERNKKRAMSILTYVWYIADIKSPANQSAMSDKEAHLAGIKFAKLEEDFEPDEITQALIIEYRQTSGGPYAKALRNGLVSIEKLNTVMEYISTKIDIAMDSLAKPLLQGETREYTLNDLMGLSKELADVSMALPGYRKKLMEAYDAVAKEEEEMVGRGDKAITNSMNPERYLKEMS